MSRSTVALSCAVALLFSATRSAADTPEVKPLPTPQVSGGVAVILASLVDAATHGSHAVDFRCVINGNARSCRTASAAAFHVIASRVTCAMSDVAVGTFSCVISLESGAQGKLSGHRAFELFSALQAAGIRTEGAAGHMELGASSVDCAMDMKALRAKAGGGASCKLTAL